MQAKQQEWPVGWQPGGPQAPEAEPLLLPQGAEAGIGPTERQKPRHWIEYLPSTTSLDTMDSANDDGDSVNGEPAPTMKPFSKPTAQKV
jgi:hypothetical protein